MDLIFRLKKAFTWRYERQCTDDTQESFRQELYPGSSNAELNELIYIIRDAASGDFNTFLTCFFAYITLAYFVGNKISNRQAIAISIPYTGAVYLMGMGILSAGDRNWYLICILRGSDTFWFGAILVGFLFFTWLLSVVYMLLVKINHATIYDG